MKQPEGAPDPRAQLVDPSNPRSVLAGATERFNGKPQAATVGELADDLLWALVLNEFEKALDRAEAAEAREAELERQEAPVAAALDRTRRRAAKAEAELATLVEAWPGLKRTCEVYHLSEFDGVEFPDDFERGPMGWYYYQGMGEEEPGPFPTKTAAVRAYCGLPPEESDS